MINRLIDYINKNFGRLILKNPNRFINILFNYFHKFFITNSNINDESLQKYLKDGYLNTKVNFSDLCEFLSLEIQKQEINPKNFRFLFKISEDMKREIRKHFQNKFPAILKPLEKFYNSKITISQIFIARNFYIESNDKKEFFSNNYHVDAHNYNLIKIFINLMDVDVKNGPLHIYSKNNTRIFMKKNKYKNRSNYIDKELEDCVFRNTGKKGDSFLANTTQCLHKAGKVKKGHYRDILFVSLISSPEKINDEDSLFFYEKKYSYDFWNSEGKILEIINSNNLKEAISLLYKYYKKKNLLTHN
jgi:hypothetical protein